MKELTYLAIFLTVSLESFSRMIALINSLVSNPCHEPRDHMELLLQVGVIRPISRDTEPGYKTTELSSDLVRDPFSEKKTKGSSAHVSNLNKINNNKTAEHDKVRHQKETLIIEKDPVFVPVESWKENTQVCVSEYQKRHSTLNWVIFCPLNLI